MFRLLKDKLAKISDSQEMLIDKSQKIASLLNRMEDISSVVGDSLVKKINKQSSSCRSLISDHVSVCKNFETFALKLYDKLNEYKMFIDDERSFIKRFHKK